MVKIYFKIAWRNLSKDLQFTLLNVIGLATGLACTLLIYLWVVDELYVDKFNTTDARLFQVLQNIPQGDGTFATIDATPALLSSALLEKMPEVESAASVIPSSWFSSKGIISVGNKQLKASEQYATRNFFTIFSYGLIAGNKEQLLSDKSSVVISEETAMKLFHTTQNVVGKTITWNHKDSGTDFNGIYTISGIFKRPLNSTAQFDILLPYQAFVDKRPNVLNWGNSDPSTYIVLKQGVDEKAFGQKIRDFNRETNRTLYKGKNIEWIGTLQLQRFSDRHLYNHFENGVQAGGRIEYVKLFSIIAFFILIIACINFMNLSTAKASGRFKDVGVRKCIGASRISLVIQYLSESILATFLSLILAFFIVFISLGPFNTLTGKHLEFNFGTGLIFPVLGITFLTALIAGSYPAFYLSGFKPVVVLKGKLHTSFAQLFIRKGLVIFQFVLSAVFIVSVLVVHQQIKFIQTTNLGYNRDNIISIKKEGNLNKGLQPFLDEVKKLRGVVDASSFAHTLTGDHGGYSLDWEGKKADQGIEFVNLEVDFGLMEMLDLKMKEGRVFSDKYGSDESKVILNESAIAAMGLKDPVGQTVSIMGDKKQIIGVVKDFHFESLHERIKPCLLQYYPNGNNILIKLDSRNQNEALSNIETFYKSYNSGLPFEYSFLDDDYRKIYAPEERIATLSRYFAGIAIVISCLGLFGLAAFTAQRRQKEIGIRKVIGASVNNIAIMLSSDFLKLIMIALLVATPVAWWAINQWLQRFAFRVDIGADTFLIASGSIILVTIVTISVQTIKASIANPVKSLRAE